jgi:hypothetical protein
MDVDEDGEITITLPLRQWRVVAAHVEGGIHREVWPILGAVYAQVNAQIVAAQEFAAAKAAAAEIKIAEAERAGQRENTADDLSSESQSNIQRAALH